MNLLVKLERNTREYMILAISLTCMLGVMPFAIMRLITNDWSIAALDISLLVAMLGLFIYVYRTHNTIFAGAVLAVLFAIVEIMTVVLKGPDQLLWTFPSTIGIYYLLNVSSGAKLNCLATICVVYAVHQEMSVAHIAAFAVCLICTNFFVILFALQNQQQKEQLEALTLKDPLTGVCNRRAFDQFTNVFDKKDKNKHDKISMLALDIDNYKSLTVRHGHVATDEAQQKLVALIRTQLHHEEKIFRLGSDNYLIAPLSLDQESAFSFAERLQNIIINSSINDQTGLTVSVGAAQYIHGETAKSWFSRADSALQAPERHAKNRPEVATTPV